MTNQEAFTKMVLHLRAQGHRSVSDTGLCIYRAKDGAMCAVGCLIPDDEYVSEMENSHVCVLTDRFKISALQGLDDSLLMNMQDIHDRYRPETWEFHFASVAESHDLTLP